MKYTATSKAGRRSFYLYNDLQFHLGILQYANWPPHKAEIRINEVAEYKIGPSSFWSLGMDITKRDQPFATIKYKIAGPIVITFPNGQTLLFKKKSVWGSNYVLINNHEEVMASVNSEFQWRNFGFTYHIDVTKEIQDKEIEFIAPYLLVYCVNYMRVRKAGY